MGSIPSKMPSIEGAIYNVFRQDVININHEGIAALEKLENDVKSIVGRPGIILFNFTHQIPDHQNPVQFLSPKETAKNIAELFKSKQLATNDFTELLLAGEINFLFIEDGVHNDQKKTVHVHPAMKEMVEKYGINLNQGGTITHLSMADLILTVFSAGELERISQAASNAFKNLQLQPNDNTPSLQTRSFSNLTGAKPLIKKSQFPKLTPTERRRIESKLNEQASINAAVTKNKREERKKEADKREEFYELRDQHRWEIKTENIKKENLKNDNKSFERRKKDL